MKVVDENLRILADTPKHGADNEGHYEREEITDAVVIRTAPVRQVRLPKASTALCPEALRVLGWKIQVLGSSYWDTQSLHLLLVVPATRGHVDREILLLLKSQQISCHWWDMKSVM